MQQQQQQQQQHWHALSMLMLMGKCAYTRRILYSKPLVTPVIMFCSRQRQQVRKQKQDQGSGGRVQKAAAPCSIRPIGMPFQRASVRRAAARCAIPCCMNPAPTRQASICQLLAAWLCSNCRHALCYRIIAG